MQQLTKVSSSSAVLIWSQVKSLEKAPQCTPSWLLLLGALHFLLSHANNSSTSPIALRRRSSLWYSARAWLFFSWCQMRERGTSTAHSCPFSSSNSAPERERAFSFALCGVRAPAAEGGRLSIDIVLCSRRCCCCCCCCRCCCCVAACTVH